MLPFTTLNADKLLHKYDGKKRMFDYILNLHHPQCITTALFPAVEMQRVNHNVTSKRDKIIVA